MRLTSAASLRFGVIVAQILNVDHPSGVPLPYHKVTVI